MLLTDTCWQTLKPEFEVSITDCALGRELTETGFPAGLHRFSAFPYINTTYGEQYKRGEELILAMNHLRTIVDRMLLSGGQPSDDAGKSSIILKRRLCVHFLTTSAQLVKHLSIPRALWLLDFRLWKEICECFNYARGLLVARKSEMSGTWKYPCRLWQIAIVDHSLRKK